MALFSHIQTTPAHWLIAGLLSAVVVIFATGIIPIIVPGFIVGACGAGFHLFRKHRAPKFPWWLSVIPITLLAISLTLLLIPDTRHWVITRFILIYYLCFGLVFSFVFEKLLSAK